MRNRYLKTKFLQWSQAWKIHGGPLKMAVAALGVRLSRVKIPSRRLRAIVYQKVYGKKYSTLNESEFEQPLASYPSLNALFTRGVRPELRPISKEPGQFVCPCDGTIQEEGRFNQNKLLTVKGVEYTLSSLLPEMDTERYENGRYAIIFLSPNDCHRIFSPQDALIEEVIHVPGYRLLVHPPFQRKDYPVFSLNERVFFRLATPLGSCILVMVAGWGVGNITYRFDKKFRTRLKKVTRKTYSEPPQVQKGDWLATFELGSTAILITESAELIASQVCVDQKVKYGQPLFNITPSPES